MGELDFTPKTPENTGTGTLNFAPYTPGPSLNVAAARSYMFQQGLDPVLNRDIDDLHATIASGREDDLRSEAANKLDLGKIRLKQAAARALPLIANPSEEAVQKVIAPVQPTDPKSVAEKAWGQAFIQKVSEAAYGNMKDTTYAETQKDWPRMVEEVKRRGGIIAAQNQEIVKWSQNAEDAIKRQGPAYSMYERGLSFLPGHDEITIRHNLASILPGFEKLGFGDYLREASMRLLTMPYDQFSQVMEDVFKPWIEQNPHTAAYVLDQLVNQSTSDRYLQNFSTLLDASSIPGLGAFAKGAKQLLGLSRKVKDVADVTAEGLTRLKWTGTEPPELKDIPEGWWAEGKRGEKDWYLVTARRAAEAAGDTKEAGIQRAAANITEDLKGNANKPKEAVEALSSNFRLDKNNFIAHIGNGGRELAIRIQNAFEAFDTNFRDLLTNLRRTETLSDVMAVPALARIIEESIKKNYRGLNNSIGDVKYLGLDPKSNAYRYELHFFNPDTQPWKTDILARTNKNLNGLLDAEVVKEGMGYKLVRTINLKENQKAVTDLIATADEGKLQTMKWEGSPMLEAVNRYRTSKEILAVDENRQRELATHSPGVLLGLSEETLRPLAKLPKGIPFTPTRKRWQQFWRALEHAKHDVDPKDGVPGRWFETGEEMDDFFLRNFNRPADPIEKEAYMAVVRNVELNRVWDTVNLYSMKAKAGVEQHSLFHYDNNGKKVSSSFIEGAISRDIENFTLGPEVPVYVQVGRGPGVVYSWGSAKHGKNPISKKIASGELKAIQIENPDFRPLADYSKIGQRRVQWAITNQVETKPLDWENQIPRRGGGHFVWDYNYYIKQAKMSQDGNFWWHEGDTTLMPISVRAMGKDIVKHLNAVQLHLREGREEAAEKYHRDNKLPFSWETHRDWYRDSHEGGVYKPARLNVNEPFHLVSKDKTVADIDNNLQGRYGKKFKDSSMEGNPSRQRMVQFTGERDARELMTIGNEGTRDNPLYTYQPATFADPIHVMNRALQRSVKSIWMQPMKDYSMYHWLKQAVQYMDVKGEDKLKTVMNSPAYYFNKGEWLAGHKDSPEVTRLESARHQIKQFVGVPSKIETSLFQIQQNLADMLYEKGFQTIPDWLMHEASDPLAYIRSAVVHMKLGLFNPSAFFVQASTHLNIWGIAGPKHAAPGTAAMFLESLARVNPKMAPALDKYAQAMGWRPGEWLEALEEYKYRGFYNIGHTHTFIDAHYQAKWMNSKWGKFLDWGHLPFREGARSVRTAAWFTAYHEWRYGPHSSSWTGDRGLAHPTGRLTKQDWDRVLSRAADLDHNMSRAANSRLQSGLMSFTTQFQAYHLRLGELMTGKRLTWQEKAGLFATSSLAYGIPLGGLGLYSPASNFIADHIMKTAQENGYTPNDHFVPDVIMRGLPDAMAGQIFGGQGNVGERWGPGKFNLDSLLNGDPGWWKVLVGATGSTFANMYLNAGPLVRAGISFITGKPEEFPMKAEDWLRPLEEISSLSDIMGFKRTLETGHLMSKNGTYISDVSRSKYVTALMRYVVGLTPQRPADIHDNLQWTQAEEASYKDAEKNIIRELHEFYDANNNNDPDQAAASYKRAMAYSVGLPVAVKTRIWTQAAKNYGKPLDMQVMQKRLLKDVPPDQAQVRGDIYRKLLEQQGK